MHRERGSEWQRHADGHQRVRYLASLRACSYFVASSSHLARSLALGRNRPYLVRVSIGEPCPSWAWITAIGVPARAARTAQARFYQAFICMELWAVLTTAS